MSTVIHHSTALLTTIDGITPETARQAVTLLADRRMLRPNHPSEHVIVENDHSAPAGKTIVAIRAGSSLAPTVATYDDGYTRLAFPPHRIAHTLRTLAAICLDAADAISEQQQP